jgi:hypothetical protein
MKFIEFRKQMAPLSVFSLRDARMIDSSFDRRRLHEWRIKDYIRTLSKGWYVFTDIDINDTLLDCIANRIYAPSYVSLETVLSRMGILPDTVRKVTSITTRKTRTVQTGFVEFTYRTVSPRFFFGYLVGTSGEKIATPEKAILDYLYLHPGLVTREDFEQLRVDPAILTKTLNRQTFDEFLARFNVAALQKRTVSFFKWVKYA